MFKKSLILGILTLFMLSFFSFSFLAAKAEGASQGWLGVYIQDINTELMEAMDLKSLKGVLVNDVIDDSPADKAGLERGDIVIEFNNERIVDTEQFTKLVRETKPDDVVNIMVIRDDDKRTLEVKIGKTKKKDIYKLSVKKPKDKKGEFRIFGFGESTLGKIGVTIWDLNDQLGEYFGVKGGEGALIAEVDEDGPGYEAGLRAGDVIIEMDGEAIEEKGDVSEFLADKEEGDEVKIEVLRKGSKKAFTVEVGEDESQFSHFFKNFDDKLVTIPSPPYMEPFIKKYQLEESKEKGLREELKELKEELMDLKKELERLKDKL
ncbi:MAG: PDZ domain-containing protein [Candidatus Zixiibacteriota bacterium]